MLIRVATVGAARGRGLLWSPDITTSLSSAGIPCPAVRLSLTVGVYVVVSYAPSSSYLVFMQS